MTEGEWAVCDDPVRMMAFLGARLDGRKGRLLACACCRRIPGVFRDARGRQALEANERFADGAETAAGLAEARALAEAAFKDRREPPEVEDAFRRSPEWSVWAALRQRDGAGRRRKPREWVGAALRTAGGWDWDENPEERAEQAALLRDVFDVPIRPEMKAAWRGPAILSLARAAYEEREQPSGLLDAARLAVLSDALEEAGCTDTAVLGHLRTEGPHVRGCWALDLVMGNS